MRKRWLVFLMSFVWILFFIGTSVEAKEVQVTNSTQFYDAWIDKSVTKIELLNDLDYSGKSMTAKAAERTTDIEISGKAPGREYGYRLKLNNNAFEVRPPTTDSGFAEIHIHDIEMENNGTTAYGTRGGIVEDHYGDAGSNVTGNKWTIKFGNVKIPGGWREYTPRYEFDANGNRVSYTDAQRKTKFNALPAQEQTKYGDGTSARLARTTRAQVNIYGKMSVFTLSENFYTGGLDFAEGTNYNGAITDSNYSAIWFRSTVLPGDAGTGNFIVHDNAKVKVRNTGSGSGYPAIYRFVRNIEVGENSELTLTVPGNSLQFVGSNQTFTAKKGSRVTLGSTDGDPSIKFDGTNGGGGTTTPETSGSTATNAKVNFEPGSSLFIIGNSSSSMIDMAKGTNNSIVLDEPLQFDIRNTVKGAKNVALEMDTARTESGNSFQVIKSNMDFWDVNTNVKETPQYSYNDVQSFLARHTNRAFDFVTTDLQMQSELPKANGRFARITGLNTVPIAEFPTIVTDADKKNEKAVRVKLGEVPDDNGMDNNGNLTFEPIYAGKDQAEVTVSDTKNTFPEKKLLTNVNGYTPLNNPNYYSSGTQLKVKARRSGLVGANQVSPNVIDATPPIIMKPENLLTSLTVNTRKMKAEKLEPGAVVYVKVNGNLAQDNGKNNKVDENGNWSFNMPSRLNAGDIVTFYLEDTSKKMPETIAYQLDDPFLGVVERTSKLNGAAPSTNNNNGNINPDGDLVYADAIFNGVTKFKVADLTPPTPKINKIARALTKDDKG
ncbi:MAG: hypothetical protein RR554_05320, partial [Vagococcus sp.]|uniref:pectate lyase-like adhesive domain-containing protein n=1 Tax=Vagococcus sp. TaxID=1933889 RepID=UPI002FCB6CCF